MQYTPNSHSFPNPQQSCTRRHVIPQTTPRHGFATSAARRRSTGAAAPPPPPRVSVLLDAGPLLAAPTRASKVLYISLQL